MPPLSSDDPNYIKQQIVIEKALTQLLQVGPRGVLHHLHEVLRSVFWTAYYDRLIVKISPVGFFSFIFTSKPESMAEITQKFSPAVAEMTRKATEISGQCLNPIRMIGLWVHLYVNSFLSPTPQPAPQGGGETDDLDWQLDPNPEIEEGSVV